MNELLNNLEKLHTTKMGIERIKINLKLNTNDVVFWCKSKISEKTTIIKKKGKNYYATNEKICITINSSSYTIITAHVIKSKKV